MKKIKLFSFLALTLVVMSFVSCGDDEKEPPVMGDKSDLIGTYTGSESAFLTDVKRDTMKVGTTVKFRLYAADASMLSVELGSLGDGILASNFRITTSEYTFGLREVNLTGLMGGQIPAYINNWFTGEGKDYDSLEKIDLKLPSTTGSFDRNTNKMTFSYTGTLTIYPKIGNVSKEAKTYAITYRFKDLVK